MAENIKLIGEITIPADKSISHRSLIFGALTKDKIRIKNLSLGEDCISTLKILEKLGVKFDFISKNDLILDSSSGLFAKENVVLDCGNSGTSARLLAGLFSGLNFSSTLIGDKSLCSRPMKRIIEPLKLMGAKIEANENKLPMKIIGSGLKGIDYYSPIASAQVKSCLLLAGLNAKGVTKITEPALSRNHSEIMLKYLGANIMTGKNEKGYYTQIEKSSLIPKDIEIAGDISSAAFFMVAAAIVPNSSVIIKNVGINETRTGILDILSQAQVKFEILNKKIISNEPTADIKVEYSENIKPFEISGSIIPRLIDEIPILAVLASQANGKSIIKDAADLRNKESDRISTIVEAFKSLGIKIQEQPDGFIIEGKNEINSKVTLMTHLDHRLAMSYYVISLINKSKMEIKGLECINTSFPEFMELISKLQNNNEQ